MNYRELHFELTYRCDSRCIICDIWQKKIDVQKELNFGEIKDFVERSELLKDIKKVILSGGEPWLRDDFVDISLFFLQYYQNASIGILSNLLNTDLIIKKLREIFKKYPDNKIWLGSSLDGVGEEYNRTRGVRGGYKRLWRTYAAIKKEFPFINIWFTFTLFPENYNQILPVYLEASKRGVGVGFQIYVQKEETEQFFWTKEKIEEVKKQINLIPNFSWREYFIRYLEEPQSFSSDCPAGEKFAMISSFGDLYLCPVYKYGDKIVGNIREHNFDRLWFSSQAKKIRKFFKESKCHCFLSCTIEDMLLKKEKVHKNFL